jgi:putative two-component system response regulator
VVRSNEPDLLIVDYMMPDINGIDFIRTLRKLYPADSVPILMVTAAHEKEVLREPPRRRQRLPHQAHRPQRVRPPRAHHAEPAESHKRLRRWNDDLREAVIRKTAEIAREQETVMRLARAAEFRDPETGAHILRMAHYSQLIARRLGLDDELCERILIAAPMHDIGKVGTPDHILLKPGRLDDDELEIMRRHARIGHDILTGSDSPMIQMAAEIALSHHENTTAAATPTAWPATPSPGRADRRGGGCLRRPHLAPPLQSRLGARARRRLPA